MTGAHVGLEHGLPLGASRTTLWQNKKAYIIAICIALGPLQYGMDNGMINGFQAMPAFLKVFGYTNAKGQLAIGTTFQQLATSLPSVGMIFGSFLLGLLSLFIGRKNCVRVSSIIGIVSFLIQVLVKTDGPIYFGRVLVGVSNSFNYMIAVLYIAEIAPAHLRGTMVQLYQPFVGVGGVIGASISNALSKGLARVKYQEQLAICFIVPVFLFFFSFVMPESPRWLATQDRDEEAINSLRRLRGKGPQAEYIEEEMATIRESVEHEKQLASSYKFIDIFKGTDLRRTLIAVGCCSLQAACGNPFITGYATYFFKVTGLKNPFQDTIIFKTVGTFCGFCGLFLATRFGRRTILLGTFTVGGLAMLITAILYTVHPTAESSGIALVALVSIYNGAFYAGMCPTGWVVASEVPSNRLRSVTFTFAMLVGNFLTWVVLYTAPYFINTADMGWGGKYGYIWAGSIAICIVWIFFFVPEMKGRSLEELDEMFENRINARDFKNYICVGGSAIPGHSGLKDGSDADSAEEKAAGYPHHYEGHVVTKV